MNLKEKVKNILVGMPEGRIYLVHKMWSTTDGEIVCQADFSKSEYAYTYVSGLLKETVSNGGLLLEAPADGITDIVSVSNINYPYILFEDKDKVWNLCAFFSDMETADAYANGNLKMEQ